MKHGITASEIRDFVYGFPTFFADIKTSPSPGALGSDGESTMQVSPKQVEGACRYRYIGVHDNRFRGNP
jgi:hypothetical protein